MPGRYVARLHSEVSANRGCSAAHVIAEDGVIGLAEQEEDALGRRRRRSAASSRINV